MMKNLKKIFGLLFFGSLLLLVFFISFNVELTEKPKIQVIEIDGNFHMSKDKYYEFANLTNRKEYPLLSTSLIKDRFEKHPYIHRADVKMDRSGNVYVKLLEKQFEALLFLKEDQYLITTEMQLVKVLPFSRAINYPVISNPKMAENSANNFVSKSSDIVTGLKIAFALKLLSPELYEGLAEIDLRNGRDILLISSLFEYPIVVGRGNEIAKVAYFNELWKKLSENKINDVLEYVDLRYDGHIFLGFPIDETKDGDAA